jgi:hypothetical protein
MESLGTITHHPYLEGVVKIYAAHSGYGEMSVEISLN